MKEEQAQVEQVILEIDGSCAVIKLGAPDEKVIVLTSKRMKSLEIAIQEIAKNSSIKGLVIAGAHPNLFCAGADINVIKSVTDVKLGKELAQMGQKIFRKIEALPFPTVAAISGACVGGGCELVLHCNYRIAIDNPQTKIGLPEIKLGILPGFGGTQKLPRLIGIEQALKIILPGKVVPVRQGKSMGLIDQLIAPGETSFDKLISVAKEIALIKQQVHKRTLGIKEYLMTHTHIGRSLVASSASKEFAKGQGKFYPAPKKALEVTLAGLRQGEEVGYDLEAQALGELVVTQESKSLVHIYFLTEGANRIGRSAKDETQSAFIGVVGAGVMGAGIAASFLQKNIPVVIYDPLADARARAESHIHESIKKMRHTSDEQKQIILSKCKITERLEDFKDCTLVIEAIVEKMEVKRELFEKLSKIVPQTTVLATNTSSLSVTEMSEGVTFPERFIGMHFFNPAEKMPLVEIVTAEKTKERAIVYTAALTAALGKYGVVVRDVPGFLVNRVLTPYLVEAAFLLSEGYSPLDIDRAALEFGMPMGPIRLLDEVGLDVAAKVSDSMEKGYGKRMKGPQYSNQLVSRGRLGRKSKSGFYLYNTKEAEFDSTINAMLGLPEAKAVLAEERSTLGLRLLLPMINEAVRCLDEGVAGAPGNDAAGQIDLATVMGTGFAPFRGGVLFFAQSFGIDAICSVLKDFANKHGDRFTPCAGLVKRAQSKEKFFS